MADDALVQRARLPEGRGQVEQQHHPVREHQRHAGGQLLAGELTAALDGLIRHAHLRAVLWHQHPEAAARAGLEFHRLAAEERVAQGQRHQPPGPGEVRRVA